MVALLCFLLMLFASPSRSADLKQRTLRSGINWPCYGGKYANDETGAGCCIEVLQRATVGAKRHTVLCSVHIPNMIFKVSTVRVVTRH
jgi:hypothetical protein